MRLVDNELSLPLLDGGIWWDFTTKQQCPGNVPHSTHGCFLVVPIIGSRYEAVHAEECLPYQELIRQNKLTDETSLQLRAKAMARTLLRDWRNWERADGSPFEFSEANAIELLTNRRWLVFAGFIAQAATATSAALVREEESAKGN